MSEKLVTIATFSLPMEAYLLKAKLESEEIDCFLIDEHMVASDVTYSNILGGVKLQVKESDASRVNAILQRDLRPRPHLSEAYDPKFNRRVLFLRWFVLATVVTVFLVMLTVMLFM